MEGRPPGSAPSSEELRWSLRGNPAGRCGHPTLPGKHALHSFPPTCPPGESAPPVEPRRAAWGAGFGPRRSLPRPQHGVRGRGCTEHPSTDIKDAGQGGGHWEEATHSPPTRFWQTPKSQQLTGTEKSVALPDTMENASIGTGWPAESAAPQGSWRSWLRRALAFVTKSFR